jgi:hypothetical protein
MQENLTRTFQISSILDMFTRAVSTSLLIAKVLMLAKISVSLGYCYGLLDTPAALFCCITSLPFLTDPLLVDSRTPTVSCPREVMSSAKLYCSKRRELVNKLSNES